MHDLDDLSPLLDALNPAQREAVCAPPGHTLVLAGAGSGKTRVLIHRIAYLMQACQVPAHAVLAVTFTNKAASEMRERLHKLSRLPIGGLWVGTFHGLAHRLLRLHWQEAQLPQGFQILDSDDQARALRRIIKNRSLDEKLWPAAKMQWYINQKKDEGLRPAQIDPGDNRHAQILWEIYEDYQQFCTRSGLVDFGELLLRTHELFKQQPALLAHYQQRFQHVLVDEFQDTNHIQYLWLRQLTGLQGAAFAVGDDDQLIYGWRGAKPGNLQQFQADFAPVQLVRLEQNYRSTGLILAAANALIHHNTARLGKTLWTSGAEGAPIGLYGARNEYDEARFITERIQAWVAQGCPYAECAVLYRSNAQSRVLEETLGAAKLPYRVYGGQRYFERAEIKDALAYLRLLANSDDDSAFERAVNTPTRGIGDTSLEQVRQLARKQGLSLWRASQHLLADNTLSARAGNALRRFLELILRLRQETAALSLSALTDQVLQQSGLLDFYRQKKGEKEQMRVENLEELVSATKQYQDDATDLSATLRAEGQTPLLAFLSNAALDAGDEQTPTNQDTVQLMTLHSAKGLEFPLVFLCGLEEQLFPHRMATQTEGGLEEERRLCYVGITRAMRQLYFSHAEVRRLHGTETYSRPSRFIQEIPSGLVEDVRLKTVAHAPYRPPAATLAHSTAEFHIGQHVSHPKFGEGVVLSGEGQGASARVEVNFGRQGVKWLVLAYANLQASPPRS